MSYGKLEDILPEYQKVYCMQEYLKDEVIENICYPDFAYYVFKDGTILYIDDIAEYSNDASCIEDLEYPQAFLPLWPDLPEKYKNQYREYACVPKNTFPVWNAIDNCVEWIPETSELENITPNPAYYLAWELPDGRVVYLNNTNVKYDDWYEIVGENDL